MNAVPGLSGAEQEGKSGAADSPRTAAKPEVIACINDAWETKLAFSSPHHLYPVVLYGWSLANENSPPPPFTSSPPRSWEFDLWDRVRCVDDIFHAEKTVCSNEVNIARFNKYIN